MSILNLPQRYTGRNGVVGFGTRLETGGTVLRYATIALMSSGLSVEYDGQSIGYGSMRDPSGRTPRVITCLI